MSTTPSNPVQSCQPKGETLRHTPTPWRAAPCGYLMGSDGVGRFGPREVQVGKIGDFFDKELLPFNRDRWQGDLELIVTAVNSHANLTARVEELEKALATEKEESASYHKFWIAERERTKDLEAALISIRSNANCHTAELALATMPLIFDIATRAMRAVLEPKGFADEIKRADAAPPEASFDNASDMLEYLDAPREAEPVTERMAFIRAYPHLDLTEVPDAWGRPMFKHSHVQALWDGWFARAVLVSPSPIPEAPGGRENIVEQMAKWLHDETAHPDSYPSHTWPETERDDGQREGGFVKIVPSHGQAYFRDIARRLVARFVRALKPQHGGNCEHGIAKVNCGICVPSEVFDGGETNS